MSRLAALKAWATRRSVGGGGSTRRTGVIGAKGYLAGLARRHYATGSVRPKIMAANLKVAKRVLGRAAGVPKSGAGRVVTPWGRL